MRAANRDARRRRAALRAALRAAVLAAPLAASWAFLALVAGGCSREPAPTAASASPAPAIASSGAPPAAPGAPEPEPARTLEVNGLLNSGFEWIADSTTTPPKYGAY